MLSLKERIKLLENDITAHPMRISVYSDLPFAIFRYDSWDEWKLRKEVKNLGTRLSKSGRNIKQLSISNLLWQIIEETEGIDAIVELEKDFGFDTAQEQITTYLSDEEWMPLSDVLANEVNELNPESDMVFLMRASSLAPDIYQVSRLLDEMQGKTRVPIILFYPGSIEGAKGLRFMGLQDRETMGNYRVKIY